MTPVIEHRKYIARETVIGTAINGLLSFAFAAAVAHGRTAIPLWGAKGIAVDFLPQNFLMIFAMTLVVTLLTRTRLRADQVRPMSNGNRLSGRLPQNAFLRALVVGLVIALVLSPLSAVVFHIAEIYELPARAFIAMKTTYGAVVTAFIAPAIVRAALAPSPGVNQVTPAKK